MPANSEETRLILRILHKYIDDYDKIRRFAKELVGKVGRKTKNQSLKQTLDHFHRLIQSRQASKAKAVANK